MFLGKMLTGDSQLSVAVSRHSREKLCRACSSRALQLVQYIDGKNLETYEKTGSSPEMAEMCHDSSAVWESSDSNGGVSNSVMSFRTWVAICQPGTVIRDLNLNQLYWPSMCMHTRN